MQSLMPAAWRQLLCPGTARTLSIALCRSLYTGHQKFQEAAEYPSSAKDTERLSSKNFSLRPPMPGENSSLTFGGIKFEEVPIAYIKATYNNTHIHLRTHDNQAISRATCGTEGFKNSKKSSTIAAQTTGIAAATKAAVKGTSHIRVVVKGMGPGRLAAIRGLTMGGLEVISITDNTPIPHNGCRPRKVRRV